MPSSVTISFELRVDHEWWQRRRGFLPYWDFFPCWGFLPAYGGFFRTDHDPPWLANELDDPLPFPVSGVDLP